MVRGCTCLGKRSWGPATRRATALPKPLRTLAQRPQASGGPTAFRSWGDTASSSGTGGGGGGGGTTGGGGGGGTTGGGGGGTSGGGQPAAPKVTLTLPTVRIASLRRTGALRIGCRLAGAGHCSLTVTITASEARKLGLKPPRHTKTLSLAHGSAVLHRSGKATIRLRFTPRFLRALAHARHGIHVTITAVSSAPGAKSVTVTRSLIL